MFFYDFIMLYYNKAYLQKMYLFSFLRFSEVNITV